MIKWIGDSKILKAGASSNPIYALPLVEEEVLRVAFDKEFAPYTRLSTRCAVNCTSRFAQRTALKGTGLNPAEWSEFLWQPGVIKSPASCENNGVFFPKVTEHIELLRRYSPALACVGVIEDFIEGEAWEIDGCIFDNQWFLFPPVQQFWNEDFTKIKKYKRGVPSPSPIDAVAKCIDALELNQCCFCIELRLTPDKKWKVIEVHARLGEDSRLAEAWGVTDPIAEIENFFGD